YGCTRLLLDLRSFLHDALPIFALVLLGEASAYPHGSGQPQIVRPGEVVLMDCGCNVHGYQSDVSRSWVHGTATARQRQVWEQMRSEEHTSELQSRENLVCRLLL